MAKTVKPLNDSQIKQSKPKDKEYSLSDGFGLLLSIKASGTKTWLFKYYKPLSKKRTNISFGQYPTTSLADARKKREEARELLAKDIDPKEFKEQQYSQQAQANINTLEKVTADWIILKRTKVSSDYADDIWQSLVNHIFPVLGTRPIHTLEAKVVIDTIRPIAAKGTLETVKRLCQRLNEIMVFAVNTGVVHHNPLAGIRAAFESPKKTPMPTIHSDELPEFLSVLARASIKFTTRCLIEWELHTMTRPNEAARARWEDIDLAKDAWIIPASIMKMRREHKIPLTPYTHHLLGLMKPISGHREYIFPADRDPKKHTNEQTANAAIKRMGFKGRLVAHGLRSLASTTINDTNKFDSKLVEVALAHQEEDKSKAAYDRADYLEARREIMNWWSEFIIKKSQINYMDL